MPSKNERYLSFGGNRCPNCGSDNIEAKSGSVEIDNGVASQGVDCNACGASWSDLYTLTGFVCDEIDPDSPAAAAACDQPNAPAPSSDAKAWLPHQLYFTRHEGVCITSMAILDLLTRSPMDDERVMNGLRGAMTEWVKETEAGRSAWRASSEDINIGDLLSDGSFNDPELVARMEIYGLRFVNGSIASGEESYAFDTVLADSPRDDDLGEMEPDDAHEAREV